MTLYELCDLYLKAAHTEKGFTHETLRTFRTRIRAFIRFVSSTELANDAKLADFNTVTLKRYLYHLVGRNQRPRTVKACFNALRSFGGWLVEQGALEQNVARDVPLPKLDAVRRELVTDQDVSDLLAACDRIHDPQRSLLCKAILSTFTFCGLRREECLSLMLDDVNLQQKCVIVRQGKGQKSRTIYPHADCLVAIREWLRLRPKGCNHQWLWAFDTNRRVHCAGLRTILEDVSAIAGLKKPVHSHDLRHSFARRCLANSMEISVLSRILGHESIRTTATYLMYDEARMRETAALGALRPASQTAPQPKPDRATVIENARSRRISARRPR